VTNSTWRRAWYLGALGIVRYVAKGGIDALAEAPLQEASFHPDEPTVQVGLVAGSLPAQPPRTNNSAPARQALAEKAPAGEIPSPQTLPNSEEELIAFRLAFWQPSPRLVVLSAMPAGVRVSKSQQEMLANLLRAISNLPNGLSAAELIDWPPRVGGPGGLEGAKHLLDVFLEVKAKLQPFTLALLMGDISARLAAGRHAQVGERVPLAMGAEGIVTHSLYDMDTSPSLKRETWVAIRHLAGEGNG